MHLRSGVDLVEVSRLEGVVDRHGKRFLQRVYTPRELTEAGGKSASLAARFAAKEAAAKALGSGIGQVTWQEIEVLRSVGDSPQLLLHGAAAQMAADQGLAVWSLSLSHTAELAIALVVAAGE